MTAPFVPADHATREAIAGNVKTNMIVEAGAGTGKSDRNIRRSTSNPGRFPGASTFCPPEPATTRNRC